MCALAPTLDPAAPVAAEMDHDLYRRLCAEFHELPGLSLTVCQAARLFTFEPMCCERVLEAMVRDGILDTDGTSFTLPADHQR
jgi:hypothetical protein